MNLLCKIINDLEFEYALLILSMSNKGLSDRILNMKFMKYKLNQESEIKNDDDKW